MITGKFFVRESAMQPSKSRQTIILVGIVGLPEGKSLEDLGLSTEHLYTISGFNPSLLAQEPQAINLTLYPSTGVDVSAISKGNGTDGLITQPIWQT